MLADLTSQLVHADPIIRLSAVRIVGLVEETTLLPSLRERYKNETEEAVRKGIDWAGKRLFAAQQRGYSTVDAIFERFNISKWMATFSSTDEEKLVRRMQHEVDMQRGVSPNITGQTAAIILGGAVGGLMGASMMAQQYATSNMMASYDRPDREAFTTQRDPTTRPTTMDISAWVRRLQIEADGRKRMELARELVGANNPAGLGALANAYFAEQEPGIREVLEKSTKMLYWQQVYYQMEHDGRLQQEIDKRLVEMGKLKSGESSAEALGANEPAKQPSQDISEILRRAEAERERRKGKR